MVEWTGPIIGQEVTMPRDPEKEYDRKAAMETVKAIIALGYRIEKTRR